MSSHNDIVDHIRQMTKEEFYKIVFKGVAGSKEFAELATFGVGGISAEVKEKVRLDMAQAGINIDPDDPDADELIDLACACITARAVTVS